MPKKISDFNLGTFFSICIEIYFKLPLQEVFSSGFNLESFSASQRLCVKN